MRGRRHLLHVYATMIIASVMARFKKDCNFAKHGKENANATSNVHWCLPDVTNNISDAASCTKYFRCCNANRLRFYMLPPRVSLQWARNYLLAALST